MTLCSYCGNQINMSILNTWVAVKTEVGKVLIHKKCYEQRKHDMMVLNNED